MRKLHHITRLDYVYGTRESHGWLVRIQRLVQGKRKAFTRTFTDAAHGGKAKALALAIAWRDENLPKHPAVRKGAGSGRLQAPIGHTVFWESKSGGRHSLNGAMKAVKGERPVQFRVAIGERGRAHAVTEARRWYHALRRILRADGVLESDAVLTAYWNRLKNVRPKARRLPW